MMLPAWLASWPTISHGGLPGRPLVMGGCLAAVVITTEGGGEGGVVGPTISQGGSWGPGQRVLCVKGYTGGTADTDMLTLIAAAATAWQHTGGGIVMTWRYVGSST